MAEKYGFFDSRLIDNIPDRMYSADDVNEIFKGIISDGVVRGYMNSLKVTPAGGMAIKVETGKAFVNDHYYINTEMTTLEVDAAHATLPRVSSVVLRFDRGNRTVKLAILNGTPAVSPIAPELAKTINCYELKLYDIKIGAGTTVIAADAITDKRTYAGGLVDSPNVNTRRYDTTNSSDRKEFAIPSNLRYSTNSFEQLYINGLLCKKSEYSIRANDEVGGYKIVFNNTIKKGADLTLILIQ